MDHSQRCSARRTRHPPNRRRRGSRSTRSRPSAPNARSHSSPGRGTTPEPPVAAQGGRGARCGRRDRRPRCHGCRRRDPAPDRDRRGRRRRPALRAQALDEVAQAVDRLRVGRPRRRPDRDAARLLRQRPDRRAARRVHLVRARQDAQPRGEPGPVARPRLDRRRLPGRHERHVLAQRRPLHPGDARRRLAGVCLGDCSTTRSASAPWPTRYTGFTQTGFDWDHLSVVDWIEQYVPGGLDSTFGKLCYYVVISEYGGPPEQQSALNLVYILATTTAATARGSSRRRRRRSTAPTRNGTSTAGTTS